MDPITVIMIAVVAGAAAGMKDVTSQAIKDAYKGLKALLLKKFGSQGDVAQALGLLEKKPEAEARQEVLAEELKMAGAGKDTELVRAAEALVALLEAGGEGIKHTYFAQVTGSGAAAQGDGAQAAGAGGIVAGGDVKISKR